MLFRNPSNGYVEDASAPWLWALLFSGLYLIVKRAWGAALIWAVVAFALFALLGPPATLIVALVNIGLAFAAGGIVRSAYMRRGWEEIAEGTAATLVPATRACPFCAEEIKAEAIKCKLCGSQVEPLKPAGPVADTTEAFQIPLPASAPGGYTVVEWQNAVAANFGAVRNFADGYDWRGAAYPTFAALVHAINESPDPK